MAWKWGVIVALAAVVLVQGFVVWTAVHHGPKVEQVQDEWKGLKR